MANSTTEQRTKLLTLPTLGEGNGIDLFREVHQGRVTEYILKVDGPDGASSEIRLPCEGALILARAIESNLELLSCPGVKLLS